MGLQRAEPQGTDGQRRSLHHQEGQRSVRVRDGVAGEARLAIPTLALGGKLGVGKIHNVELLGHKGKVTVHAG